LTEASRSERIALTGLPEKGGMNLRKLSIAPFLILALALALSGTTGCSMMKPPAMEEEPSPVPEEPAAEETSTTPEYKYTHEQVVDAITATLTSRQFRFALKRTDVAKGEVETQWRDEEAFEGSSGGGAYGTEDKYRSYVIVDYDFARNRVNIKRVAQAFDFYINDWRDITPRRYHRDEDMQIQKVVMETLEEEGSEQPEATETPQ
jgi:hypothetical protein